MADGAPQLLSNWLLAGLSDAHLARLAPELEPVELPLGVTLERPGEPIEHVYFLASGLVSVVAVGTDGKRIGTGLFGRDGMTGLAVVMGDDQSPHETLIQMTGSGHRIGTGALREAMAAEPAIREHLMRFAQAFAIQGAHTTLANGRYPIQARLARWLLMCHDRMDGDLLHLTHDFLSLIAGRAPS